MAQKGIMENDQDRTTQGDTSAPPRVRMKLTSAEDVRRELARLYREARADRVPVADASRLANILQILGRAIETSDLEQRLAALEVTRK